ncbi:hypothetical protein L0P88_17800 [Muricauda sp. SCSIO 64092]|uniref:hypothetical protein n=1 Tax=Allomuricauda sp. SCSIO 64092 TaxID=2908842 RepID=UPI001FF1B312|nr:hypothetical protein [Muricauda sp. SCSIO 64092]UOY05781.1 hypothetical protein L0P88_17800 [Muricauda sp. SCSIO 64092]
MKNCFKYLGLSLLFLISCNKDFNIQIEESFKEAKAYTKGNTLNISTGKITRVWELTPQGLLTQSIESYKSLGSPFGSDWNLSGILSENAEAKLTELTTRKSNDYGFTSDHLEVTAEFEYPGDGVGVKYVVWAYPNATGLRTQLFVKKLGNYKDKGSTDSTSVTRAEYIPLKTEGSETSLIGYYNDTQHRNTRETEILKEETTRGKGTYNWASVIDIKSRDNGIILVQESHKCVNQQGVHTGAFYVDEPGVYASGLGISVDDLTETYNPLWAYWVVSYQGDGSDRQLALKQFDRKRFPIDPKRDIYIMANNWGSGASGDESKYASREANTLIEIESQRDLGIDLHQVDDGWQGNQYNIWDAPAKQTKTKTYGVYDVYPKGWTNIKEAAEKAGVRLGLWAAWTIPGKDLLAQYKTGGFTSYKLDFANLNSYEKLHGFVNKVRQFVLDTDHKVRVNWDVTENPPRIGYFYGREYGNIYLENRKPMIPENVVYRPHLVLRDAWQVAKYTNLNKFQVSVQNIDRVNRKESDAYLHNHPYSVAIALMGSPIFFQETHYYTNEARDQIRTILKTYKKHRDAMYKGYVFPVGNKPDNSSWSGFQNYNPEINNGYLTIFREINNGEATKTMRLHFIKNTTLILTDLLTGDSEEKEVDGEGNIDFEISKVADFRFYQFQVK